MKSYTLAGIVLIVIAFGALVYEGVSYMTREKVVDIGPLKMTVEKTRKLPLPPIVGLVALAGGIVMLVIGRKQG